LREKNSIAITKNCSIPNTKAHDNVLNKTCELVLKELECTFVSKFSGYCFEYNSRGEQAQTPVLCILQWSFTALYSCLHRFPYFLFISQTYRQVNEFFFYVFLTVHHSTDFSNYQLSAQCFYFSTIYMLHYTPQHVSSRTLLIIRRTSCITTASGIVTLCKHTVWLLTEGENTRGCGDTIGPPDDEQRAARNMLRSVV